MSRTKHSLLLITLSAVAFGSARGAPLAPNDPSLSGNLKLWLTDAANNFSGGTWNDSSGNGNHATTVGTVNVAGSVTYLSPTLNLAATTIDQNTSAVDFAGNANDLLGASNLNGNTGLSELTIFSVYNVTLFGGNSNLTRPLGFGSISATQTVVGNVFNLAGDPSIRKDNGNIGAGAYSAPHPVNTSFIRITRMDAGGVDEWFNTTPTLTPVLTNTGTPFTVAVDEFYLGDLRAGVTNVPGVSAGTSTSDFSISQVLVYNGTLSDVQIEGINEWILTVAPPGGARFEITTFTVDEPLAMVTLAWNSRPNATYAVDYSDDFVTWMELTDNVASQGSETVFPFTNPAPLSSLRFFRVRR